MKFNELIKSEPYKAYELNLTYFWQYPNTYLDNEDGERVRLPYFIVADDEYSYSGDIAGWYEYLKAYDCWDGIWEDIPASSLLIDDDAKLISFEYVAEDYQQHILSEPEWARYKAGYYGEFRE